MLKLPTKLIIIIFLLLISTALYIYFNKDTSRNYNQVPAITAITYTTKSMGPLEPDNTYIEITPTPGLATSSREKINQTLYQAARSNSCFYAEPFDRKKISAYLNGLESDKYIDPETLDDEALLARYSVLVPHEIVGDFTITFNRDSLLSVTHLVYDSYCDTDTRSIRGTSNYLTFDLNTGKQLTLLEMVGDTAGLQASLQEKISTTYAYLQTIDDEDNPNLDCYESLINDSLLLKDDSFLKFITFKLSTDQLEIIPQGYPSAIAGVCGGTSITFSYPDIGRYLQPESPLLRLLPV